MSIKGANQIRKAVRKTELPDNLTLLQRAIYHAAAPILHKPDVKTYQERERTILARKYFWKISKWPMIGTVFSVLGAATALILTGRSVWVWDFESFRPIVSLFLWAVSVGLCHFAIRVIRMGLRESTSASYAQWGSMPWKSFSHPEQGNKIPGLIRRRVKRIQGVCPEAYCEVEYLAEDPFLIVQHQGERYYVGVWDESGFVG